MNNRKTRSKSKSTRPWRCKSKRKERMKTAKASCTTCTRVSAKFSPNSTTLVEVVAQSASRSFHWRIQEVGKKRRRKISTMTTRNSRSELIFCALTPAITDSTSSVFTEIGSCRESQKRTSLAASSNSRYLRRKNAPFVEEWLKFPRSSKFVNRQRSTLKSKTMGTMID